MTFNLASKHDPRCNVARHGDEYQCERLSGCEVSEGTFCVFGNHGTMAVSIQTGEVLELDVDSLPADDPAAYVDILCFDVQELRDAYEANGEAFNPDHVDILDIGFWTTAGKYESRARNPLTGEEEPLTATAPNPCDLDKQKDDAISDLKKHLRGKILTQADVLLALAAVCTTEENDKAIAAAREQFNDEDIEIDDLPLVSRADAGTWVSAWLWVQDDEADASDDDK